jgi:GNAT superfamily N-acetyltransferase
MCTLSSVIFNTYHRQVYISEFPSCSNFLGCRSACPAQLFSLWKWDVAGDVYGIGPVYVDKDFQGRGVGRELMMALLEKAKGDGAKSTRNTQSVQDD